MVKDGDSSVECKLHCTNNCRATLFREHQLTRFDAGDFGGAELSDTKLMAQDYVRSEERRVGKEC